MADNHRSWGSPASIGASKGAGPMAGAGELPPKGPGKAAMKYARGGRDRMETPNAPTPSADVKGLSVYKAGNPPPRGYK